MTYEKTLTIQQILNTKVWGTTVCEWISESYWRELCRRFDFDVDKHHTSAVSIEGDLVHISVTVI